MLKLHDGGIPRDMSQPLEEFGTYQQDEKDVSNYAERCLPKVGPHMIGKACTYTMTPDEDFIIDKHPDYNHVVVACGFSGHGFKFSSVVGEILSQLVTENRESKLDISSFTMKRFLK